MRAPWALSGIAVCGGCGANINALSHASGKRRVRCAGRTQGNGCDEPSCYASIIEDQIGELLQQFLLPAFERERLLALWQHYQRRDVNVMAERERLRRKLTRLREAYLESELAKTEYQTRKAMVVQELAALPADDDADEVTGQRLAAFLKDVAGAWGEANDWSGTSWRGSSLPRW